MVYEFRWQRRVEFAETDMAGILHFSNYFRYMEETEHAFFRSLGHSVHAPDDGGAFGWARGHAACTYARPLHYEDVVDIQLLVRGKREKSIDYVFVFRLQDAEIARGAITAVCVGKLPGQPLRAMRMPAAIDALIEVAPAALLA